MQVEESTSRRHLRSALIVGLLVASLAIPAWLWVTRGRGLPLRVVLDPPVYVVPAGAVVPLRLRLLPAPIDEEEVVLSWEGQGIKPGRPATKTVWRAPEEPGTYAVTVKVRRSGTMVQDTVSFQVVAQDPKRMTLSRPPALASPPSTPAPCDGVAPAVKVHSDACAGGNVVLEVTGQQPVDAWHSSSGRSGWTARGRWAELVLPEQKPWPTIETVVIDRQRGCAWKVHTGLSGSACRAGPSQAVFADFIWQLVSPGHFRFAAKPARAPAPRFGRYHWDFGDGTRKSTARPLVSHRFKGPARRYRLVGLEVSSPEGKARTVRLVVDRSVD